MKRKKRKFKRWFKNFLIIISLIGLGLALYIYIVPKITPFFNKKNHVDVLDDVIEHYNKYVVTSKNTFLYDDKFNKIGEISKGVELTLDDLKNKKKSKYFRISDFDNKYYIKYSDVSKIDNLKNISDRYKKYILFNENIVTNDKTPFYDDMDNLIYEIDKSFSFPIIIKDNDKYGVEFNNRLLFVKNEDVKSIESSNNTDKSNSSGIGVLNYHAFYDENNEEERANCVTEICHSKSQFKTHLDYFKENDILTLRMNEVEMYIDGKIRLPKSVLITIDDGDRTKIAVDMLTEYKMYGTIFLITSWFDTSSYYTTDYVELHSHSDNMHNPGVCPTGQGGGIQCLSEDKIQDDLKATRSKLNNTTYFCYPFYEYNEYSIEMLKKAGFTMAFIGESRHSDNLVHVGSDKFRLRRFVIVTYTTLNDLDNYFGQIK